MEMDLQQYMDAEPSGTAAGGAGGESAGAGGAPGSDGSKCLID